MNYRKISLLSFITAFFTMLFSQLVTASHVAAHTGTSKFSEIFYDIITFRFMGAIGIGSTGDPMEGLVRVLLFIALFAILYKGAQLLKLGNNIAIVISFAFSAISIFFIPASVIVAAGTSYGTLVSFLILAIPIGICGLVFYLLKDHHWLRLLVISLVIWVLHQMRGHLAHYTPGVLAPTPAPVVGAGAGALSNFFGSVLPVYSLLGYALIGAYIFGVITLIQAFGSTSAEHQPNWLTKHIAKGVQKFPGTEGHIKLQHAKREKTRILNSIVTAKELHGSLKELLDKVLAWQGISYHFIKTPWGVHSANDLETISNQLDSVLATFKAVHDDDTRWKRSERREVPEMKKLIKELIDKGISQKVIDDLNEKEKVTLSLFIKTQKEITAIEGVFNGIESAFDTAHDLFMDGYEDPANDENKSLFASTPPVREREAKKALLLIEKSMAPLIAHINKARTHEEDAMNTLATMEKTIKDKLVV